MPDEWLVPYPVRCIASRSASDEAACTMLAQLLKNDGITRGGSRLPTWTVHKGFKLDTVECAHSCASRISVPPRNRRMCEIGLRLNR